MRHLSLAYIDGAFVPVQGREVVDIVNPATESRIARAPLASTDEMKKKIAGIC